MRKRTIRWIAGMLVAIPMVGFSAGCPHHHHKDDDQPLQGSQGSSMGNMGNCIAEGKGGVECEAPSGGKINIVDANTGKVVYSGKVSEEDLIKVSPMNDTIYISGTTHKAKMPNNDTYRVEMAK